MADTNQVKEVLEFIWDKFEFLIRRTILPSTTFFMLIIIIYLHHKNLILTETELKLLQSQSWIILIFLFFTTLLSVNYMLKISAQLAFDNFIKVNYDTSFCLYKEESISFVKFRKRVLLKLQQDKIIDFEAKNLSDFELYQLLGRVLGYYKKKTDVRRYATDTKEAGITIISIFIFLLWYIFLENKGILLFSIVPLYYISFQYIKSKYRSRAYRMYANYLIGEKPEQKDTQSIIIV